MKYAISCGDPAGIGPEIVINSLEELEDSSNEFLLVTAKGVWEKVSDIVDTSILSKPNIETIFIDDIHRIPEFGNGTKISGEISFKSVKKAAKLVLQDNADVLVTAPINKLAWHKAGYDYPGHTEYLAEISDVDTFAMAFVAGRFRVILATIHEPIKAVPRLLDFKTVLNKIKIGADFLDKIDEKPEVFVIGLNPHAGEDGRIGTEENFIEKAIVNAQQLGIDCYGPFVADAFFRKWSNKASGIVLAMYHDQGLIPFKMMAKNRGVNITLGLPFIRTSPDHGTAFDIAGKGVADIGSMVSALKIAEKLYNSEVHIK